MSDYLNRRRGAVPYAYPANHKGYSAYSRETYKGAELDYRGRSRREVERDLQRQKDEKALYCDRDDDRVAL